ncbi:MAG: response regulator [Rudaea sp.]
MKTQGPGPHVLIVDDDPVSLRFLAAAVTQSGCEVVAADRGHAALAKSGTFDLLLLDRHLPDTSGADLLHRLRERGCHAPAIATSAEIDAATAMDLRAAGFADVLEKPATMEQIRCLLARHLPQSILDDAAALATTGGDAAAMRALRALLVQELTQLQGDLRQGDLAAHALAFDERLHRLRAACGFCGATALAAAAADLQGTVRNGRTATNDELGSFLALCDRTVESLRV